jgi:hypothetical protein
MSSTVGRAVRGALAAVVAASRMFPKQEAQYILYFVADASDAPSDVSTAHIKPSECVVLTQSLIKGESKLIGSAILTHKTHRTTRKH